MFDVLWYDGWDRVEGSERRNSVEHSERTTITMPANYI